MPLGPGSLTWEWLISGVEPLVNFGRVHHGEQFCEIIFEFGSVVQENMSFKRFLIWSSVSPPVWSSRTIFMQFWKRASFGIFMWSYMEFWPVVQKEMSFKDISYLELWQPLCSADPNHLCIFDRRYHEERFCEIILNLNQLFSRKCRLNVVLIWISVSLFVQRSVTICAIFVESIMRNNSVKLFWILVSGSGGDFV